MSIETKVTLGLEHTGEDAKGLEVAITKIAHTLRASSPEAFELLVRLVRDRALDQIIQCSGDPGETARGRAQESLRMADLLTRKVPS